MSKNKSFTANYAPASPFLGRSRFSVIPEEPHGSPSQGTPATEKQPSPEWDFDDDKRVVSVSLVSFLIVSLINSYIKLINYSSV